MGLGLVAVQYTIKDIIANEGMPMISSMFDLYMRFIPSRTLWCMVEDFLSVAAATVSSIKPTKMKIATMIRCLVVCYISMFATCGR